MRVPKKGPLKRPRCYAAPRPTQDEMLALERECNRTGSDFLKVDLATALTFAENARSSEDAAKRRRNLKSARKAYDTVLKLAQKVTLSNGDAEEIKEKLGKLRSELIELGEVF